MLRNQPRFYASVFLIAALCVSQNPETIFSSTGSIFSVDHVLSITKLAALIMDDYHQRKKIINSVFGVSQNYEYEANATSLNGRQAWLPEVTAPSPSSGDEELDEELSDPLSAASTASSKWALDKERLEVAST